MTIMESSISSKRRPEALQRESFTMPSACSSLLTPTRHVGMGKAMVSQERVETHVSITGKMLHRWPKIAPQMVNTRPKGPKLTPNWAQMASKKSQMGPRWQDGSKLAPKAPKMGPKGPQEGLPRPSNIEAEKGRPRVNLKCGFGPFWGPSWGPYRAYVGPHEGS